MVNLSQIHIINIHHLLFPVDVTMPVVIQVLVDRPPPVIHCVEISLFRMIRFPFLFETFRWRAPLKRFTVL